MITPTRACAIGAMLLALAPVAARAADYTTTITLPNADQSGLHAAIGVGFGGCGGGATSWRCPTPGAAAVRLTPSAAAPKGSSAEMLFLAPPATSVSAATVRIRYHVLTPGVHARLLYRTGTAAWKVTALPDRRVDGVLIVPVPAGATEFGASLYTSAAVPAAVRSAVSDVLSVETIGVALRDTTRPVVVDAGQLDDATWHRGSTCFTVDARDSGLGVHDVRVTAGTTVATVEAPRGTRLQPRPLTFHGEPCLDTTTLPDGLQLVTASAGDGVDDGGNRSTAMGFSVLVDNTRPEAEVTVPTQTEDRLPTIAGHAVDRASGVAAIAVTIDGNAVDTVTGAAGAFTARLATLLSWGTHVVAWTVVDAAGNTTNGRSEMTVADVTAPLIDAIQPADGAEVSGAVTVSFAMSDPLSGVAIETLRVAIDGREVEGAGTIANGVFLLAAAAYDPGRHDVRIRVADRAGNIAERASTFLVPVPVPDPKPLELLTPATALVQAGTRSTLHVHVERGGVPERGVRITFGWGTGSAIGSAVSDEAGIADVVLDGSRDGTLWVRGGDAATTIQVRLQRGVTLSASTTNACRSCWITLRGRVAPASAGIIIESYHDGGWHAFRTVRGDARGAYSLRIRPRARGLYVFRATTGGVTSATVQVWVR